MLQFEHAVQHKESHCNRCTFKQCTVYQCFQYPPPSSDKETILAYTTKEYLRQDLHLTFSNELIYFLLYISDFICFILFTLHSTVTPWSSYITSWTGKTLTMSTYTVWNHTMFPILPCVTLIYWTVCTHNAQVRCLLGFLFHKVMQKH